MRLEAAEGAVLGRGERGKEGEGAGGGCQEYWWGREGRGKGRRSGREIEGGGGEKGHARYEGGGVEGCVVEEEVAGERFGIWMVAC